MAPSVSWVPGLLALALTLAALLALAPAASADSLQGQAPSAAAPANPASPRAATAPVYFPLLASNLRSASAPPGVGPFQGVGRRVTWEEDPRFGEVLTCSKDEESYVQIPGLQYGQSSGFAVALWAMLEPSGEGFLQYMYSHNGLDTDLAYGPNAVALYAPEQDHPNFGVVRAMVRDATDVIPDGDIPMFLDSNGCIADPTCTVPGYKSLFSPNGSWHLLALGTQPQGGKGFRLYVDGQLAASVSGQTDVESLGSVVTGGGPMNLTGNVTLCGRSDLDPLRFFTGSLAHLFIWNRSVTEEEMRQLFEAEPQPGLSG
ncbi:hypothetical protein ABPG75_006807 [Micractinium tetrahymenae]